LAPVMDGMLEFASMYNGDLVTETMLVMGLNDSVEHIEELADFLAHLRPTRAYLSIPIRPPAEAWVQAPGEETLNRAFQVLSGKVGHVELLIAYEGNAFAYTGDVETDLLSITAVHPMREDAIDKFLTRAGKGWSAIHKLVTQSQLIETEYKGHKFYTRKLGRML